MIRDWFIPLSELYVWWPWRPIAQPCDDWKKAVETEIFALNTKNFSQKDIMS